MESTTSLYDVTRCCMDESISMPPSAFKSTSTVPAARLNTANEFANQSLDGAGSGRRGANVTNEFANQSLEGAGSGRRGADMATIQCRLDNKELWDKFHELGTEMIITKSGRYVRYTRLQGQLTLGLWEEPISTVC